MEIKIKHADDKRTVMLRLIEFFFLLRSIDMIELPYGNSSMCMFYTINKQFLSSSFLINQGFHELCHGPTSSKFSILSFTRI